MDILRVGLTWKSWPVGLRESVAIKLGEALRQYRQGSPDSTPPLEA